MGDDDNNVGANLPPGFRFHPSDEELVVHFLHRKAALLPCHPDVIPDLHLYAYDPWDLHGRALEEGKQWYFFSRKTQERVTENGYWKDVGMDEPVVTNAGGRRVGVKKYYVFYAGESPAGNKTNWIMHEYRLSSGAASTSTSTSTTSRASSKRKTTRPNKIDYSKWVVCRVYEHNYEEEANELSCLDEVFLSLDDMDEVSLPNYN